MKLRDKTLLCAAVALAVCTAASAVTPDPEPNPYSGIVDRNVFGLKPAPPPPDPEANRPPPPKLTLTGILSGSIFGGKRAIMKAPPSAGKPGEPGKGEQSYVLGIGQRDGDVEVLDINDKPGSESVRVNNAGITVVLTFEHDGQKPSGGAPVPGAPPVAGAIPPPNPANPFKPAGSTSPGFVPPSRPMRYPGAANSLSPPTIGGGGFSSSAYNGSSGVTMGGAPNMNIGGQNISLAGGPQPQNQPQPQNTGPQLSPEEQTLLIEAQRLQYQRAGSPIANLLPRTAVTPPMPGQAGAAQPPPRAQ